MPVIQLDDGRTDRVEVLGNAGEPLLFFPGGPGYGAVVVRDDGQMLAERFTVYLIDPHGSGSSPPPANPEDYSPQGTARFYNNVRRTLGLGNVNFGVVSF